MAFHPEATDSAVAVTALMKIKGIGRRGAIKILSKAPADLNAGILRQLLAEHLPKTPPSGEEVFQAWHESLSQIERGYDSGVAAFALSDLQYPERLRRIPDPPAVLFVKGNLDALHMPHALAVVGTREPTEFGSKVARRSGKSAAESGFVIVSGLALGCDTQGHEGCLEGRGIGVIVLAHGLDRVYPAANRGLAERILETGGCLVAEYPFGTAPVRTAFAERDRIQSGLSDGVLVIETDVRGGTMHTVRFAREQHRALACIDHPEKWRSEPKTKGNQMLIAENQAVPIAEATGLSRFLASVKQGVESPTTSPQAPEQVAMDF